VHSWLLIPEGFADSKAGPGSCGKPPGEFYTGSGEGRNSPFISLFSSCSASAATCWFAVLWCCTHAAPWKLCAERGTAVRRCEGRR